MEDHPQRPDKDHEVEPQRPVPDVPEIEPDPDAVVPLASSRDLPETGDPGLDQTIGRGVLPVAAFELLACHRTGSHEAHLSSQDIDDLGKFVKARPSQEFSDSRNPRIMDELVLFFKLPFEKWILLQHFFQRLLRPLNHRPELDDPEGPSVSPDPPLGKEDRARRGEGDQTPQDRKDWKKRKGQKEGKKEVGEILDASVHPGFQVVVDSQEKDLFIEEVGQLAVDQIHLGDVRNEIDREDVPLDLVDERRQAFTAHLRMRHHRSPDLEGLHDFREFGQPPQHRNHRGLLARE